MCKAYSQKTSIHSEPESNPSFNEKIYLLYINSFLKSCYNIILLFQSGVEPLHKVFQTNALPVSYWNNTLYKKSNDSLKIVSYLQSIS